MSDFPRVLILADDLTGAMDAAGPFAARGVATWLVAVPERCDERALDGAAVVSVNTESRHLDEAAAAARVEAAFRKVGGARFPVLVKKVDSTLRGNVVAETRALLRASGRAGALVAPAFPSQGRTVEGGLVLVRGIPLGDTAFARDALSPALAVPLAEAFRAAAVSAEVRDARTDADLDAIVGTLARSGPDPMLVGSAGITSALGRALVPTPRTAVLPQVSGPIVYVVGSRAQASRDQVERLASAGALVLRAPNGLVAALPGSAARDCVLLCVPGSDGREGDPMRVADALAAAGLGLAERMAAGAVVATGGDTAIALLRASGNAALEVGGEVMPGIAFARLRLPRGTPWLVTKAGGFGDADALLQIGRRLRAGCAG